MSLFELIQQGNKLLNLGQYEEAIECYNKVIELDDKKIPAYDNKGCALFKLGRNNEAIECFNKAIEYKSDFPDLWYNKGYTLYEIREYKEAIICFDEVIKLNPKDVDAYIYKGIALSDLKKYEEAKKCYDKARELDPSYVASYAPAYYNKGNDLRNQRKYEEAKKCYDKAIELNPNYVEAYNNKSGILYSLGEYKEAIECCEEAIQLDPTNVKAYNNKGAIYDKLEKYEEGVKCYDHVIKIAPDSILVYCNRGKIYQKLGKNYQAALDFQKAKSLFDQGKLEGLSSTNITFIKNTLDSVIKLLDSFNILESEIKKLIASKKISDTQSKEINQEVEEKQKDFTNILSKTDFDKGGDTAEVPKLLQQIQVDIQEIQSRVSTLEKENIELKKENQEIKAELDTKQDDHFIILKTLLKESELTDEEKGKLKKYFKEFVSFLGRNYIASSVIASDRVEAKVNHQTIIPMVAEATIDIVPNYLSILLKALQKGTNYIYKKRAENNAKAISNIAHDISAFNDIVGFVARTIILKKKNEILSTKEESTSNFMKFVESAKDFMDKEFFAKIDNAKADLKPVIKLAAQDATIIIAACILGKIDLETDDACYTDIKNQLIELVLNDKEFKNEFDNTLNNQNQDKQN
jgi:tetratricopeptide (TPR) repeat protein